MRFQYLMDPASEVYWSFDSGRRPRCSWVRTAFLPGGGNLTLGEIKLSDISERG